MREIFRRVVSITVVNGVYCVCRLLFVFSIICECFSGLNAPRVSAKKVILLDTSNSTTELRWRTHSNMDEDEIGWLEETYRGPEGIENRRAYVVCNVEHPNVDNWLRTPRIDRNGANRMHVEVSFTMRDCTEFPGNARSCKETFRLYAAQVDASGDAPAVWDESHWDLIDRITADTGRHSLHESSSASVNVETRSYTVTKDGVYFSFRDSGACISILNVMIYYEVCAEVKRSFIIFPQTITGPEAHSIIAVQGKCVENASPVGTLKPTYVCKATGAWDMPTGECKCNAGYMGSAKESVCTACAIGTYKAQLGDAECKPCPGNSISTSKASLECQCDAGYYRADGESIQLPCTQAPSKPSRLTAVRIDTTSVMIEWDEPSMLGGRKELWYRYKCTSCPPSTRAIPAEKTFTGRRLELSGLEAGGTYTVMVFAENKVSKFKSDLMSEYALIEFTTRSLTPMLVSELRVEGVQQNGVTLAWNAPVLEGNGHSNGHFRQPVYEIESRHNGSVAVSETANNYFTFDDLNPVFPYSFKVRALTDLGWGMWSEPLWYQPGRGQFSPMHTVTGGDYITHEGGFIDHNWALGGPPVWVWILVLCVVLVMVVFSLLVCSRKSKGNRKQFSDCDGLEPYKNGTLTPDYNTPPPPQGLMQNLFRGKLGAPLISYGTQSSSAAACYGNTRFKPYVDPTAYEDPSQALSQFANDVDASLIRITEVIGSGEFGEVCRGVLQCAQSTTGTGFDMNQIQTVAIKTLKPGSSEKSKSDFLTEASIMGQFQHENVIRLIGVVTKSEPVMIITEYMENGSLDQFLRKHDDGMLGVRQIVDMLRGIAAGMKYLTEKGFVHRDLAARNVLVDAELRCKIADFGLSRGLVEGSVEQEYTTNGGKIPVRWTAPEAITHRKFTAASDVWSFGVVMWEVCSFGERPYWEWTNQKVISEITLGYRLPAPMDTPQTLHNLMMTCWNIDRHKRPTFAYILQTLEHFAKNPELIYAEEAGLMSSQGTMMNNGTGTAFGATYMSMGMMGQMGGAMVSTNDGGGGGSLLQRRGVHVPAPVAPHHHGGGGGSTLLAPVAAPIPPASSPPPIPLEEFLTRLTLCHCLGQLRAAGVHSVSDLMKMSQIDLLSYGLIADEAQRIRDALNRPLSSTLQRQTSSNHNNGSSLRLMHSPSIPLRADSRQNAASVTAAISPAGNGHIPAGFFV